MHIKREQFKRSFIARLTWFLATLFFVLLYWWVMTNFVLRDFWDPQFALKHDFLRAKVKENPDHPLWVVLGSSRVESDLRLIPVLDRFQKKGTPMIYNFGLAGSDLFRQYVCLRRLIEDGPKPQRAGIEIVGPFLSYKQSGFTTSPTLIVRARRDEIDEYCTFSFYPEVTRDVWERSRIDPIYKYGMKLPHQALSLRLIPIPPLWRLEKHFYDKWGWVKVPPAPIPKEEFDEGFAKAKAYFMDDPATFEVSENNRRAMKLILDLCSKEKVDVFLFQMPEAKEYQALYSDHVNAVIKSYLDQVKSDYGVPMLDCRLWYPDKQDYTDGSHLNATGVEKFTPRFVDEVLKFAK